jgi:hypothetical protein
MRPEDLIPVFLDALETLAKEAARAVLAWDGIAPLKEECDEWLNEDEDEREDEQGHLLVDYLFDALNEYAPSFTYFGAHLGDGSDYGFWTDIESAREQCEYVGDGEPGEGFRGEWLHVNDHGNAALYVRDEDGNDEEVWSVV